jgi:hypothetical protein
MKGGWISAFWSNRMSRLLHYCVGGTESSIEHKETTYLTGKDREMVLLQIFRTWCWNSRSGDIPTESQPEKLDNARRKAKNRNRNRKTESHVNWNWNCYLFQVLVEQWQISTIDTSFDHTKLGYTLKSGLPMWISSVTILICVENISNWLTMGYRVSSK